VLRRTSAEELPHLKSYRLEGADQQSDQWLSKTINNNRLKTGTRLKFTEAGNLPKPVKVALRVRENVAQTKDELLQWVKSLNPGLTLNTVGRSRVIGLTSHYCIVIIKKLLLGTSVCEEEWLFIDWTECEKKNYLNCFA
jgi:hypothetical protein